MIVDYVAFGHRSIPCGRRLRRVGHGYDLTPVCSPNTALGVAAPKCRGLHQLTNLADRGSTVRMGKTVSWRRR
jgi:hypothetical protein